MDIFGSSDIGRVREDNQDNFYYEKINNELCFGFVCDGMGGANGGDVASGIATRVLCDSFSKNLKMDLNSSQLHELIKSSFSFANLEILNFSNTNSNFCGMGTTVVGFIVLENLVYIFNVGDSRAYLFNDFGLKQLTIDHSYVQTLVDCGKITIDEARVHPRKNEITRALGIAKKVDFDFNFFEIKKNNFLLLCSDGLTNSCVETEIERILKLKKSIKQMVFSLIDCANANDGSDNITVVLLKV